MNVCPNISPLRGEFSKPSYWYSHSFSRIEFLIRAIAENKIGRSRLTSISTPNGYIPYRNRIWFRGPVEGVDIFPVFYMKAGEHPWDIAERIEKCFNINAAHVPVSGDNYVREQEWYALGKIDLSKVRVNVVMYWNRADPRLIEVLRHLCLLRGYRCLPFSKELPFG